MLCSQCRLLRRAGGSVRPTATLRDLYFLFFFDKHPESRQNLAEQCNRISQEIIRASWSLETTLFVLETDEKRSPTKWMIVLACFPVVYSPVHWNGTYTFYSLYADDVFLSFYIRISEQVIWQKRNCITIMWRMPSFSGLPDPFCRWLKCCVCVTHECRGQFPGMPKCQHGRRGGLLLPKGQSDSPNGGFASLNLPFNSPHLSQYSNLKSSVCHFPGPQRWQWH